MFEKVYDRWKSEASGAVRLYALAAACAAAAAIAVGFVCARRLRLRAEPIRPRRRLSHRRRGLHCRDADPSGRLRHSRRQASAGGACASRSRDALLVAPRRPSTRSPWGSDRPGGRREAPPPASGARRRGVRAGLRREASALRRAPPGFFHGLDESKQRQDQEDDENRPEAARRVIAPARTVRLGRQRADQQNDDDNEKNETHRAPAFHARSVRACYNPVDHGSVLR